MVHEEHLAVLSLIDGLSNTSYDLEFLLQGICDLLSNKLVALPDDLSSLAVAQNYPGHAQINQLFCCNLSEECLSAKNHRQCADMIELWPIPKGESTVMRG